MGEKRRSARNRTAEKVLSLVIWFVVLIGVLTVGYALLPIIQITFNILILETEISLGIVIFVVITAIFALTAIKFISGATALIGLTSDNLAKLMPNLASSRLGHIRKIFLNFCFLVLIVIAYWAASPFIAMIPSIGIMLNTALKIVVVAVIILFFWSIGGTIYAEIETAIGKIVNSSEVRSSLSKVEEKTLKAFVYLLAFILIVIASYVLAPLIRFSFNIFIPTTTISIGLLTFVVILGILGLIAARFMSNTAALLGMTSETLAIFMPNLASIHMQSTIHRIFIDFNLLIFILIIYWVFYNLVVLMPTIGIILADASQVVVAAVLVVFFWDIGRTIYNKLEDLMGRFAE